VEVLETWRARKRVRGYKLTTDTVNSGLENEEEEINNNVGLWPLYSTISPPTVPPPLKLL